MFVKLTPSERMARERTGLIYRTCISSRRVETGTASAIRPCDYVPQLQGTHSLSLELAWREQNKGVSPPVEIVSVARSKGARVT